LSAKKSPVAEARGKIPSVARIGYRENNGLPIRRFAPEQPDRAAHPRQNFADAAAALWLDGEVVHTEDLILHDAHMDIRAPTHELTRAHAVLRARRRIFGQKPDWALSRPGLVVLRGREGQGGGSAASAGRAGSGSDAGGDRRGGRRRRPC
jgi:uncharacterized membrane protein YgcG